MASLTIEQDKTVRQHLATLAKAIRAKFANTAYQGEYYNTVTDETYGDRVQSGTIATIAGIRYLLVFNLLVARNTGGTLSARVSAWSVSENGTLVGVWAVKRTPLKGIKITPRGVTGGTVEGIAGIVSPFFNAGRGNIKVGRRLTPVVTVHTDKNGDNPYDTTESHLLPFGGHDGAMSRLMK